MSVNGVTGASDVYSTYSAPSKSTEVKSETAAANTAADTGVVYEPSQEAKAASAKKYTPDANLIAKLKADSDARTSQFKSLVEKMLLGQGKTYNNANDIWSILSSGDFSVDPANAFQRVIMKNDDFAAFQKMNVSFYIITVFKSVSESGHGVFRSVFVV